MPQQPGQQWVKGYDAGPAYVAVNLSFVISIPGARPLFYPANGQSTPQTPVRRC